MNRFRKRLKKLGKKALIRLIKSLRNEIARLHRAINTLREDLKELKRQVNIACDEAMILRKQLAEPVPPRIQIRDEDDRVLNDDTPQSLEELQENYEALQADFAAVTDGMSGPEVAQQIRESEDFHSSLKEYEEIGWVITYTENDEPEQYVAELIAASSLEAKSKFLDTKAYVDRTCHETSPKMFPEVFHTCQIISVKPKEEEEETVCLSEIDPGDRFRLVQGDNPPTFVLSYQHEFLCISNGEDDFTGIITTDTKDPVSGCNLKLQWKGLHRKGCWDMRQIKAKLISNKEDS